VAEHILPPARPGQLRSDGGRGEWNEGVVGVVPDPGREPLIEARRLNGLGRGSRAGGATRRRRAAQTGTWVEIAGEPA
jgi:hypothetical protein